MTHPQVSGITAPGRATVHTEDELIHAVREADAAKTPLRLVAPNAPAPEGFSGQVVEVATQGMTVNDEGCSVDTLVYCGGVQVRIAAGHDWQEFVALAVQREWVGVERLSRYRGTIGEATTTNVAAFGQSVADTVAAVRTWDRVDQSRRYFAMVDCGFDADGSRFTRELMPDGSPRYVLLDVDFLFRQGDLTDPIDDPDLARLLHISQGQRAPLAQAYDAVQDSRAG